MSDIGGSEAIDGFKESVLKTETSGDVIELCPIRLRAYYRIEPHAPPLV